MEYEMETDYQQDYIAQPEPNQEEYQQIQYLYNMLYQVGTLLFQHVGVNSTK